MMHAIDNVAKLGPGDVIQEGYTVLDTGEDECRRSDTYRFEQSFEKRRRTNTEINSNVADEESTMTLAFVLKLDASGELDATAEDPVIQ